MIDFHTHAFPPWLRERRDRYLETDATFGELFSNPRANMSTADELVEAMDADGVDASVVMGMGWTDHGLAVEVNDYLAESVRRYPGRLYGFGGVNPAWGGRAAREAERCAAAGLVGIGELHPDTQAYEIGDKRVMAPVMEAARHLGLIVATHSSEPVGHLYPGKGATRPESLWRFILAFPDVAIVCAHWGGGLPFYALMPEVEESLSNVYFDSAASPLLYSASVFPTVTALAGAGASPAGQRLPVAARAPADRRGAADRGVGGGPDGYPGGQRGAAAGARDGGRWCAWVTPIPSTGSGQALTFPHRGGRD